MEHTDILLKQAVIMEDHNYSDSKQANVLLKQENEQNVCDTNKDSISISLVVSEIKNDSSHKVEIDVTAVVAMSKLKALCNLFILTFTFMLLFTSYKSFENIQSTVNVEDGLGVIGLCVLYSSMIITSIFLVPLITSRFSNKWIMVVSMGTYLLYLATGFYSTWATVLPSAVFLGTGAAHLWSAQTIYLYDLAKSYSIATHSKATHAISLFTGIFYGLFFTNQIWGNLVSSLVFQEQISTNNTNTSGYVSPAPRHCGAAFCPADAINNTNIRSPSTQQMQLFTGFCLGLGGLAVVCMAFFLQNMPTEKKLNVNFTQTIKSLVRHMLFSKKQKLLFMTTILGGLSPAFVVGDFTIAFVSCPLGVDYVGFVMIAYGVSSAVCSLLAGKVARITGNLFLFSLAYVIQISVCITMLLWTPDSNHILVIFLVVVLLAVCDGVYITTIIAVYGHEFEDSREASTATCRVCDSIGFAVSFGYSSFLCTNHKIYIVIGVASLSMVCLVVLHLTDQKHQKKGS